MADEVLTPELEAINKVGAQVEGFKKDLGAKADKAEFDNISKNLKDLKEGLKDWSGDKIEAKMKEINDSIEKVGKQMGEMQEDLATAKDKGSKISKIELLDEADLSAQVKRFFPNGDSRSKDRAGMNIKINGGIVLRTKAAETFGYGSFFEGVDGVTTDISAFTGRVVDPRLYERKRKRNFILDNFSIPSISAPILIYLEKIEVSGDDASSEDTGSADWIASGGEKPKRSFRVTSTQVEAKKVAIFGTVEDKLLRDVPSLRNWIQTDFTDEMREAYNDALLNNDPGVDDLAPLGLKQDAVQYSDVAGFVIATPNDIDAIIAAVAQLARNHEEPAYVAVSTDKYYQLLALKDSQQRYQNNNLVYVSNLGTLYIVGVPIIMADAEDIATTHLMAVGVDGFQIRNYGSLVFEAGLNGEDFRNDRTSFRAYQEVLSYFPSHRHNSVIYDTFANIKTAIGS